MPFGINFLVLIKIDDFIHKQDLFGAHTACLTCNGTIFIVCQNAGNCRIVSILCSVRIVRFGFCAVHRTLNWPRIRNGYARDEPFDFDRNHINRIDVN